MPEFAAYEPDRPSAERAVPTIAPLRPSDVAECAALAAAREGDDLERWVEVFRRRAAADPVTTFVARVDGRRVPQKGETIYVYPNADHVHVFNKSNGQRLS